MFSKLRIRNYITNAPEKDPEQVQQDDERERIEAEIARDIEDTVAKELAQWEATYGDGFSPDFLEPDLFEPDLTVGTSLHNQHEGFDSLKFRDVLYTPARFSLSTLEEEDEEDKSRICPSVTVREIRACDFLQDELSEHGFSVEPAVDELADPSRLSMLKETLSPWISYTDLLEKPGLTQRHTATSDPTLYLNHEEGFHDGVSIVEAHLDMIQPPELAMDTVQLTEESVQLMNRDQETSQQRRLYKAQWTSEWTKQLEDAEHPIFMTDELERPVSPGVKVEQVLPDMFKSVERSTTQDRRKEDLDYCNCDCKHTFPPSPAFPNEVARPPQAVRSVSAPILKGSDNVSKTHKRTQSLPSLDTTLLGQRQAILTSRGLVGSVESSPASTNNTTISPASSRADSMSLLPHQKTSKMAKVDSDDMTLNERRAMLHRRRNSHPSSPLSSRQGAQGSENAGQSSQISSSIDTGTRQKIATPGPDKTRRQSLLYRSWRSSLTTVHEIPQADEVRTEVLLRLKHAEQVKQEELDLRQRTRQALRDGIMRERPLEVDEMHRKSMRRMQKTAYQHV